MTFDKETINKISRILSFFWAFPIILIWRQSFFYNRFHLVKIRSNRIGHFAPDGAEQVARYNLDKSKKFYYCFDQIISNKHWAKMLKTKLPVLNFLTYIFFWNNKIFKDKKFTSFGTQTHSRDIYSLYNKVDVQINFKKKDNEEGFSWLKKFGFVSGDKFICLIVRDNAYLNQHYKNENWDYHSYRNSDIKNYKDGIEWLISKNYWVIRMGQINSEKIEINSNKFIDFSYQQNKSDLLDIWLFANCNGCITTGTGPDGISHIYDKPCLGVNWMPLMDIHSYHDIITYPKYLYNVNGKSLTINEYLTNNYYKTEDYQKKNIIIKELSSTQILKAFKEFYNYKLNCKEIDNKYLDLNYKFWQKVIESDPENKFHKKIHKKALISEEWINDHPKLFY